MASSVPNKLGKTSKDDGSDFQGQKILIISVHVSFVIDSFSALAVWYKVFFCWVKASMYQMSKPMLLSQQITSRESSQQSRGRTTDQSRKLQHLEASWSDDDDLDG